MADVHRLTVEVTTNRGRLAAQEVVETLLAGKTTPEQAARITEELLGPSARIAVSG
ncbi:hypothetical protein H7J07_05160 [Mycobacterium koreense]|uniref:hypothetical protein n=1 Tax=Mycolicibacillus koreensis TaxID=1069220 RepID=UPI00138BCE14|nr:hypothetical protein [Mycolicibacillus koreensis]MCV7247613.1 hypothetical protein [Mycolicibacillus koreensis]BBY53991.1 hypothetical protein MKOR_12420 [Mycolicibacillus koreensis]